MSDLQASVSVITLVIVVGAVIMGLRSLRVIHQNVNSNLSAIRTENEKLNEEVRKLLGREHSLEMLQHATEERAIQAEKMEKGE